MNIRIPTAHIDKIEMDLSSGLNNLHIKFRLPDSHGRCMDDEVPHVLYVKPEWCAILDEEYLMLEI